MGRHKTRHACGTISKFGLSSASLGKSTWQVNYPQMYTLRREQGGFLASHCAALRCPDHTTASAVFRRRWLVRAQPACLSGHDGGPRPQGGKQVVAYGH